MIRAQRPLPTLIVHVMLCYVDAALQSHQWFGGHPYGQTSTHIKMYSALWTGHIYYPTVSC